MLHKVLLKSEFFFFLLKNISSGYFGWCMNNLVVCVKSLYNFLGILNMLCIDFFFFFGIDNTGPNSPIFLIKKKKLLFLCFKPNKPIKSTAKNHIAVEKPTLTGVDRFQLCEYWSLSV